VNFFSVAISEQILTYMEQSGKPYFCKDPKGEHWLSFLWNIKFFVEYQPS